MPVWPTATEYFWHNLPMGFLGFVTFIVALFLALVAFLAIRKQKSSPPIYISFAVFITGVGFLGLILALRAVIMDRQLLYIINNYLYIFVTMFGPGGLFFVYYLSERRYRLMRLLALLAVIASIFAIVGILQDKAFLPRWHQFSFGQYPVTGFYLKPWGYLGSAAVLFFALPYLIYLLWQKNQPRSRIYMISGYAVQLVLIISNFPALLGYDFPPLAILSFVPMLVMAYGVFRSNFINLGDLLFYKQGLFYFLIFLLSMTFLFISFMVLIGLTPADYAESKWYPWAFLPLLSAIMVFLLAIIIAGDNPTQRLHQVGAFTLIILGFYLIMALIRTLELPAIIDLRLNQLGYVFFSFAPAIQLRFVFLSMRQKIPRYIYLFDALSLTSSALAMTPYYFSGFYAYRFGTVPAASWGANLFGLAGLLGVLVGFSVWLRRTRDPEQGTTPTANFVTLSIIFSSLLLVLSLPATEGVAFYSFGNLQFIPAAFIAYGILRHSSIPLHKQAFLVSRRVSLLAVLILPIVGSMLYSQWHQEKFIAETFFHIFLVTLPLFLFFFILFFILTRPLALQLDEAYGDLARQKQKAEEKGSELQRTMTELEQANEELVNTRDALWGEMELAKKIQTALLPPTPTLELCDIAAYMQVANEVGGDYYDIIKHGNQDWFVIGDVSGHGVPAGLVMMMTKIALQTAIKEKDNANPAEILTDVNIILYHNLKGMQYDKYMTITLFAVDSHGNLYYAGLHQDILLFRKQQRRVERIPTDGMWVGLIEDITPHIATHKLDVAVGDILLLFTDGLTESFYDTGDSDEQIKNIDNMYGVQQLTHHFERLARQGKKPKQIIEDLLPTLQPYRVFDDLTLLVLQRL